jgi:hypothetical protein
VKKTRQNKDSLRRDQPRRITPELMALHKRRAKQLRDEAYIGAICRLWAWLKKTMR